LTINEISIDIYLNIISIKIEGDSYIWRTVTINEFIIVKWCEVIYWVSWHKSLQHNDNVAPKVDIKIPQENGCNAVSSPSVLFNSYGNKNTNSWFGIDQLFVYLAVKSLGLYFGEPDIRLDIDTFRYTGNPY